MTREYVQLAIDRALRHDSGIDVSVLEVPGFSTGVQRRIWNNLVAGLGQYLEVGAYFGGTACAAINNNSNLYSVIFENGSQEFHGRPIIEELKTNIQKHAPSPLNYTIIEADFFAEKPEYKDRFDFFFYDGSHDEESQAKALPHAFDILADTFLFAVDDYNWTDVWRGTDRGFDVLEGKVELVEAWTLRGEKQQDDPIYHNGILITLCKKT